MRGTSHPGTGVPTGAVCSMAAAVEGHQVPAIPLLAGFLAAAEETARPTELPVCCSTWGLLPLPSTSYHHTTQAYQHCLLTGTDIYIC